MEERAELQRGLLQLDGSVFFLILLILSILFSFWSLLIHRGQVAAALRGGDAQSLPSPLPFKRASSALVIGSLGFFFRLALGTLERAQTGEDPLALRSAQVNILASVLVLGAALLRFYDLLLNEYREQTGTLSQLQFDEIDDLPPV